MGQQNPDRWIVDQTFSLADLHNGWSKQKSFLDNKFSIKRGI
jgi:hypothetical protein